MVVTKLTIYWKCWIWQDYLGQTTAIIKLKMTKIITIIILGFEKGDVLEIY